MGHPGRDRVVSIRVLACECSLRLCPPNNRSLPVSESGYCPLTEPWLQLRRRFGEMMEGYYGRKVIRLSGE